jgi:peptide/nickel transport system permease protein
MYWKYVVRRLLYAALILVVCVFVFSLLFNTVADKVLRAQIDEQVKGELTQLNKTSQTPIRPEQQLAIRQERTALLYDRFHLNEPMLSRIMFRTFSSLSFNFGESMQMKSMGGSTQVTTIIFERVPRTLLLFGVAAVIDIILGVWLGLVKARRSGKAMDRATDIVTMVVFGLPAWWLGMMLIMLFAFAIPIFPSSAMHASPPPAEALGYFLDLLYHLVLPVATLVLLGFWGRAYLTRNLVLSTLQEDFIMSARARGLSERRILFGHTLRAAAPPIVTMSVLALVVSIGGGLVFEGIFSWPGLGNLYWQAVQQNDVPVLMADLTVTTALFIAALAFLDLVYGFLDPRVKVGGKA